MTEITVDAFTFGLIIGALAVLAVTRYVEWWEADRDRVIRLRHMAFSNRLAAAKTDEERDRIWARFAITKGEL